MFKISKKEFVEVLTTKQSLLALSKFRWNDGVCVAFMDKVAKVNDGVEMRTAVKKGNRLVFSDDSSLDFTQHGEKAYFKYVNNFGITFYVQRTTVYDGFDGANHQNYVIYIVE